MDGTLSPRICMDQGHKTARRRHIKSLAGFIGSEKELFEL